MGESTSDTLRLTPSNLRSAILFIAMLIWLGIGFSRYLAVGGLLWIGLSLVGLVGALVYGLMLLPGSSYLEATPERLTICTAFRKREYAWQQLGAFRVDTLLHKPVVKYEVMLTGGSEPSQDESTQREETLPDTYGLTPQEMADRLNTYRRRYG